MQILRALLIFSCVFSVPLYVEAATFSSVLSNNSVNVGNIFTLRLVANTEGKAINQGSATIHFPTDLLEVSAVSKGSSIFNLWVEEPAYSNVSGTISFDAGVPNPGYTGSSGTVLNVTFHAKKAGTATFSISDAAIRANDGFGTDILSGASGAQISVLSAAPVVVPVVTPTVKPTTAAPTATTENITALTSITHPDQNKWYATTVPTLGWVLGKGVTAVQTSLSANEKTTPSVLYQPAITEKTLDTLADGTWYFAIRQRTAGVWGAVERYRLQIDATAPALDTPAVVYDTTAEEIVISNIHAFDTHSGIAKYEVSIDGEAAQEISSENVQSGKYVLPYNVGGTHTVSLRVIDGAGNTSEKTSTFNVPVPLIEQTLFTLFGFNINVLWSLVGIVGISLVSLIATGIILMRIMMLRTGTKIRATKREQVLHRALSVFKTDMESHLKKLEHAGSVRELTAEEKNIRENFGENIEDLEKYLKKEFKKFD